MQGIVLSASQFNSLVTGTKPTLSTDSTRPALEYIKLEVKPGEVSAFSCNGYAASRVTLQNFATSATFTGYFRPIRVPKMPSGYERQVTLIKDERTLIVTVESKYGKIQYRFDDVDYPKNLGAVIDEAKKKNTFVGAFDANLFSSSLAATKAAPSSKNTFYLYGAPSDTESAYFRSETHEKVNTIYEGVLLPVRTIHPAPQLK